MKTVQVMSFLCFFMLLLVVGTSCEKTECCVLPEVAELHGSWKFERVHYGFTNTTRTATELGYTEQMKIDGSTLRLLRYRDGQKVEDTRFSVSEQGETNIITFEDSETYSYYTVFEENGSTKLSLYERAPVGVVLADGGMYFYTKE